MPSPFRLLSRLRRRHVPLQSIEREAAAPRWLPLLSAVFVLAIALGAAFWSWDYARRQQAGDGPIVLLAVGIAGALLVTAMSVILLRTRARASAETGLARTALREREVRLEGIVRSAMEAIITVDESQRILLFNPMAERIFRCSAAEVLGTSLDRFIPARFRASHGELVRRFGVTGVSERQMAPQRALYGVRADGEEFPIEASISQNLEGAAKLYTVMLRDITERQRADEELKTSRRDLQQLSANILMAREDEKLRIARELHDDLGQQLTALKMELGFLEGRIAEADPAQVMGRMRGLVDGMVASVRRIASDLRPVMLDDLGLGPAIEWLGSEFGARYGVQTSVVLDLDELDLHNAAATAVFRIVQEALTNVARHARATQVNIEIFRLRDQCVVRVADNGRGMPPEAVARHKSFGLLGIRERTRSLGGNVAVETSPDNGFVLTVSLPIDTIVKKGDA